MAQRSRRGCWTCKRRHKKCDEAQPSCRRCVQASILCEGYEMRLTWGSSTTSTALSSSGAAGPVVAGPARGARRPRKAPIYREAASLAPLTPTLGDPDLSPSSTMESSCSSATDIDLLLAQHAKRDNTVDVFLEDVTAQRLLQEFKTHGYKLLTGRTGHATLLETGVVPLCSSSVALRHACIAVQASTEPDSIRLTPAYLQSALSHYLDELGQPDKLYLDSTLAAGVLLCTVSINSLYIWTPLLSGLRDVLQQRGLLGQGDTALSPATPVARHLFEVIALLDLPCLTVNRLSPPLNLWRDHLAAPSALALLAEPIEQSTGLPYSLISIMADLTSPNAEARLKEWPGVVVDNFIEIQMWDAFRYAGILHSRILRHNTSDPAAKANAAASLPPPLVPCAALLRCRIFACIQAVIDSGAFTFREPIARGMLYPMYVAGLLARAPHERRLARVAFQHRLTPLGQDSMENVVYDIVTEVWARTAAAAAASPAAISPSGVRRHADEDRIASLYDDGHGGDDGDDGGVVRDAAKMAMAAEIAAARNVEVHLY